MFSRRSIFFFLAFLFCGRAPSLMAMSAIETSQFAEAIGKEGNMVLAQQYYEKALEGNLTSTQKAVVSFNLGSVLSAQDKWEEALKDVRSVGVNPETSPRMASHVYGLKAAICFRAARVRINQLPSSHNVDDDWESAVLLLKESLEAVSAVKLAQEYLVKLGGAKKESAPDEEYLNTMQVEAEARALLKRALLNPQGKKTQRYVIKSMEDLRTQCGWGAYQLQIAAIALVQSAKVSGPAENNKTGQEESFLTP